MAPVLPVCFNVTKRFRKDKKNDKAREQLLFKEQVSNVQFFSLEKAGQRGSFTGLCRTVHRERRVERGPAAEEPQVQPAGSGLRTKESNSYENMRLTCKHFYNRVLKIYRLKRKLDMLPE